MTFDAAAAYSVAIEIAICLNTGARCPTELSLSAAKLLTAARDEIERLREEVAKLRKERNDSADS